MKDMMMEVYNRLIDNPLIREKTSFINDNGKTEYRIKFYEVPETLDTTKPFIVIDNFLGPQTNAYFANNKALSIQFNYQINVESMDRMTTKQISKAVEETMKQIGFGRLDGGLDQYFNETKRFVDARRYRKNTQIHDTDY
ncbi:hypothetical protein [Enterococcus faecalis]|uniref:hypothetical protein n=1 Tax=Enterococcus faecalis TaxID=1351 RepID=UPI00032EAACB|nr:hypothetical protein [Enterococcus faecalis]EOK56650.1 hypothetical protein Q97_00260 [Enterococcus faecalis EnGen0061]MCD4940495.1 hypothetical protein [Enterococcus faecalis]NST96902.1 hypothetical protein [Enterococcus faecalis]